MPLEQVFVFGDTGCRDNKKQEPCTDEAVWPFKTLIERAVSSIKADTVPTVLHVGDFRYANKGEPDSWTAPQDDDPTWGGWKQEFFDPAKSLLERGAWIPVRGNHDACSEQCWALCVSLAESIRRHHAEVSVIGESGFPK